MKKDIWLKPGKELNTGAIIGGIGFAIYIALSALEWRGLALFAALAFGLEAGYAFLSALDCREKDKDSVSYNIVWARRRGEDDIPSIGLRADVSY